LPVEIQISQAICEICACDGGAFCGFAGLAEVALTVAVGFDFALEARDLVWSSFAAIVYASFIRFYFGETSSSSFVRGKSLQIRPKTALLPIAWQILTG
jgi:hypothetical protein